MAVVHKVAHHPVDVVAKLMAEHLVLTQFTAKTALGSEAAAITGQQIVICGGGSI